MYLHLGQNTVIRQRDVVGVFDMDNTTIARATRDYLAAAENGGAVTTVSPELPKSFVICSRNTRVGRLRKRKRDAVYIAQISPRTLVKRAKTLMCKEEFIHE